MLSFARCAARRAAAEKLGTSQYDAVLTDDKMPEGKRETLEADARACDGAQPATAPLRDGVLRLSFTADDLVASLKQRVNLTPQAEAQVRGTFERWHRDTCRQTGQDPGGRRLPAELRRGQTGPSTGAASRAEDASRDARGGADERLRSARLSRLGRAR